VDFIVRLRKLQISQGFTNDAIFAMDETACWMDMPADTTVEFRGAQSVSVKTTGHEKNHFTVVLTAKADGTKLKPFIVFKGQGTRLIKDLSTIPGVVVRFSKNGWMNDSLTIEYLKTIIGSFTFTKRLMVWDAYKCHISEAVKAECRHMKLEMAIIPGGCTKFMQAADVVWNTPFKSLLRNHYDTWLSESSCHEYTKGGNMKPPSRRLLCNWVKLSWDALSIDTIKKSFLSCAITSPTDGSKDDEIHCFKEGQPCADGKNLLSEEIEAECDPNDPFEEESDEEELEKNEACIDDDGVSLEMEEQMEEDDDNEDDN
jgi:hypothetical protein